MSLDYIVNLPQKLPFLLERLQKRADTASRQEIEAEVRQILLRVQEEGDDALLDYTRRFDAPEIQAPLRVPEQALDEALAQMNPADIEIIQEAAKNIRTYHEAQKERSWFITRPDGTILGQKVQPIHRAGLYVPGGRGGNTPLLSSLLMTALPAQVAGVEELAVLSPPRQDSTLNPVLLATAKLLGLTEVYSFGGAWGIAALAYGTQSVAPVDMIAGPGNLWVTTAKRLVQSQVGIDMIAGPSEVVIIADSLPKSDWIIADMLAQLEHDPMASAILLTDSLKKAEEVFCRLKEASLELPRKDIIDQSLKWTFVCTVQNLDIAVEMANKIAPEHLEIITESPWDLVANIKNAGAIFLGQYSPEPIGDYFAGANHVLPTMGTARFSSGLSVQTFTKRSSIIAASERFTCKTIDSVARMARMEHLEGHAKSMEKRRLF